MKMYLWLLLTLIPLSSRAQPQWKPEPPPTPLKAVLDQHPTARGEEKILKMLIETRGATPERLLYAPAELFDRETPIENFTAAHHAWQTHQVSASVLKGPLLTGKPSNSLPVQGAIYWVRNRLSSELRKSGVNELDADYSARRLFDLLDLAAMTENDRGLPFFDDFVQAFSDPLWVGYAQKLESLIQANFNNAISDHQSLFDLALDATGGKRDRAVKLLGLLLSADVRSERYFRYFKTRAAQSTVTTVTRLPALIRTYAEFIRVFSEYNRRVDPAADTFTYPGESKSGALRSQYFWTEAYLAQRLLESGFAPETVRLLCRGLVERFQQIRLQRQAIGSGLRTGLRLSLAGGTALGLGGELFNQVFLQGDAGMGLGWALGAAGGAWAAVKRVQDPKTAAMRASQPELKALSFSGIDFAIANATLSCNGAFGGGPDAPVLTERAPR